MGLFLRTPGQQQDMCAVFAGNSRAGRLDYVAAWYQKAAEYIQNTRIEAAFVSTNSIVQGEQAPILWSDLFDNFGLTMPPELRQAHRENDRAVMRAYGFDVKTTTESSCVAELMKMYRKTAER